MDVLMKFVSLKSLSILKFVLIFTFFWVFSTSTFAQKANIQPLSCKKLFSVRTTPQPKLITSKSEESSPEALEGAASYFNKLAKDQWKFYSDNANASTNYLPPDNVKVEKGKPLVVDYRTSPTNIGLYMLSTVTAQKMGFITQKEAVTRLKQTVETIKKLPKFISTIKDKDGVEHKVEHLYNWYSINGTPAEIGNKFISTVDNGNLAAFLVSTISALGTSEPALVQDLKNIVERMRFDIFYDAKENALYHGAQVTDGKLNFTSGHYDMLISEARSAYATAIMLGQIPKSAWTNLKSKLGKEFDNININPKLKLQSYTGTMFEYLTPRLFMRHEGTPLGEADDQALKLQMEDVVGGIWGKSEANSNTSRGYAAWGVPSLSQSKEFTANGDQVIAPYASQMAAGLSPVAVAKNLSVMDKKGLRGPYGQVESVTIKGSGKSLQYQVTPQFYAHHVGMGFVSLANYLNKDIVQDWFHNSPYNKNQVVESLLKTETNQYRQPSMKKNKASSTVVSDAYAYEPKVSYKTSEILGNGEFVAHVPGLGGSTWLGKNYALTHNEVFYVRDNKTQKILPLDLSAPHGVRDVKGVKYFDYSFPEPAGGSIDVSVEVSVSSVNKTKVSKVIINNRTKTPRDLQVTGYVEWIMDDVNAYLNHPVYRNLYVETDLTKNGRGITARRRTMQGPDQDRQPHGFFALSDTTKGTADWADSSRQNILGRLGNLSAPKAVVEGKSEGKFGATLDPAGALAKSITVAPGKSGEVGFVLGFTDNKELVPQLLTGAATKVKSKSSVPTLPPDETYDRMSELYRRTTRDARINNSPKQVNLINSKPEEIGHFTEGGRKFIIDDPFAPQKPWSQVVSNGKYGFVASHSGWAYSFGSNSQQARVTPYQPDSTTESPLRGVIVKDKKSGETFSITPNPAPSKNGKYEVEVSPGYIKYKFRRNDGLAMTMTMFVAKENPVEFWQINVENGSKKDVDLELSSFMKWAMGTNYPRTAAQTTVSYDSKQRAIFAKSPDAMNPESVAFHSIVGDNGQAKQNSLFSTSDDPFSGLTTDMSVASGQKKELSFMVGLGENEAANNKYLKLYNSTAKVEKERKGALADIGETLDGLQVKTPDESLNTMLNTWLPYQARYAHFLARSGFYQSGGAFGFRDQLQTVMNMISSGDPKARTIAREHIIESCRHQFDKGDVEHWWHPHNNLGQRSTISDNLLWLPLAISQYVDVTGDTTILKELAPFAVASRELKPGELDFVEAMPFSKEKKSVYDHAKKAIDLVLNERMGEHGIPLMGKGDWNDGLDRVGHLGKGESVWLGFFMYDVLNKYAKIANLQGDTQTQKRYLAEAAKLKVNLDKSAWNGKNFIRAYADNGEKLTINDAIVQSWAGLSKGADPAKTKKALDSAVKDLYKPKDNMILLFDKPLDQQAWGGSAAAYPKGVRENGQYTHGVQWLSRAVAEQGDGDKAYELYKSVFPTTHAADPRYGAEPYSVAADIYGDKKAGEAGWTWYSGGPGWIYRTGVDTVLGLQFKDGNKLFINPTMPTKWPGYEATYKNGSSLYKIKVENPDHVSSGVQKIIVDGVEINSAAGISLIDDGLEHQVRVVMGAVKKAKIP